VAASLVSVSLHLRQEQKQTDFLASTDTILGCGNVFFGILAAYQPVSFSFVVMKFMSAQYLSFGCGI